MRPSAAVRRWRPWLMWIALAAVAAVALAVGAQRSTGPQTVAQRTEAIAAQLRCPVCDGETVAQSSATASVDIRAAIRQDILAGETPGQVKAGLVARYGPSILEAPSASGVGLLVWVVPAVVVAAAVVGLAVLFAWWRPRRRLASDDDRDLVGGALAGEPGNVGR